MSDNYFMIRRTDRNGQRFFLKALGTANRGEWTRTKMNGMTFPMEDKANAEAMVLANAPEQKDKGTTFATVEYSGVNGSYVMETEWKYGWTE